MPAIPNSEDVKCIHIKVDTDEPVFALSGVHMQACYHEEQSSSSAPSSSGPSKTSLCISLFYQAVRIHAINGDPVPTGRAIPKHLEDPRPLKEVGLS